MLEVDPVAEFLFFARKDMYKEGSTGRIDLDKARIQDPFEFESGDFLFRRKILPNPFQQVEIVFEKGDPIWIMQLYGSLITKDLTIDQFNKRLNDVLFENTWKGVPRATDRASQNFIKYTITSNGCFHNFEGYEILYAGEHDEYQAKFHGGLIRPK